MDVAGKRITVMGLGRHGGGVAAARYLAGLGGRVTVTDCAPAEQLRASLAELRDAPIACFALGEHREADFRQAQIVVVNPAVPPDSPLVDLARQSGALVTSEMELFLRACPAAVVGVTGSVGKSTTSAMIAAILTAGGRRTWLGGNIGRSLLPELSDMTPADVVILELSSFQLARLPDDCPGPQLAVVTGCVPQHLDWHGSYAHYVQSKQRILKLQPQHSAAVLSLADPEVGSWAPWVRGRLCRPGDEASVPPLRVPGRHNRQNAALAAAAALAMGAHPAAVECGLANFSGLPHRLELVHEAGGRKFFNDSMATMPESTLAALEALAGPTWLLAGGYEKGADFLPLAEAVGRLVRGAALYGAAGPRLYELIRQAAPDFPAARFQTLDEAFAWCLAAARPGENLLLSPACASYDQFTDYSHRAARFCELARGAEGMTAPLGPARPD